MFFLDDYKYVRDNLDTPSTDLAKKLNISVLMVDFYKEHNRLSPALWQEKQLFIGDTNSLKPTKTFPELYVDKNGLLAIKHKDTFYAKTYFIYNRRRDANAKVKQMPSINMAGKRFMLKKLIAEAIGLDIKDGIMVKDGNELNLVPGNITTKVEYANMTRKSCAVCGKEINKKETICASCRKKKEKTNLRINEAINIEKQLRTNKKRITNRQFEVLELYKKGLSISSIAKELKTSRQNISETIKVLRKKAEL